MIATPLRKLALLLAATACALLATEIGLRLAGLGADGASPYRTGGLVGGHALTVPHPELLVRLAPDARFLGYYELDERGWRRADAGVAALASGGDADPYRIVALGDSSTFGLGVRNVDAWPMRLAALLGTLLADVSGVEILNGGIPGYSTWQNRVQLDSDVLALRPDLVIVMPTGHNDASGTRDLGDAEAARHNTSVWGWLERTRLARVLGLAVESEAAAGIIGPEGRGPRRVPPAQYRENLQAMASLTHAAGVPLLLVVGPHSSDSRVPAPKNREAEQAVVDVATTAGVPLADPRDAFEAAAPRSLFVDAIHPDPVGQGLIALSVATTLLRDDRLLPPTPRRTALRAWLHVRDAGLDDGAQATLLAAAPPLLLELLAAYASSPDVDRAIAAGDPALPEAVRQHDPLGGRARDPYGSTAERLLARRAEDAGDATGAAAALRRARRIESFVVGDDLLGRLLPEVRDGGMPSADRLALARALVVFETALGTLPPRTDRRLARVDALTADGADEEALDVLDQVLELAPANVEALERRGLLLRRLNRGTEAEETFARVLALAPESPLAHTFLARRHMQHARSDEAESALRRAIDADPSYHRARYLLGTLLMQRGELDEAAMQLQTARAFGPGYPDIPELLERIEEQRRTPGS